MAFGLPHDGKTYYQPGKFGHRLVDNPQAGTNFPGQPIGGIGRSLLVNTWGVRPEYAGVVFHKKGM